MKAKQIYICNQMRKTQNYYLQNSFLSEFHTLIIYVNLMVYIYSLSFNTEKRKGSDVSFMSPFGPDQEDHMGVMD